MLQLTNNLFQGLYVVFYSLGTPLLCTLNISCYLLSSAECKDVIFSRPLVFSHTVSSPKHSHVSGIQNTLQRKYSIVF